MSLPGPTKAAIQSCTIAGADFTGRTIKLSVFETLCKCYITGSVMVRDDQNLINSLNLRGGEPVTFSIFAGDGLTYAMTLYILKMAGEPASNNLRSINYTIDLIGPEYFGDRANMVQQSFKNLPGTAIAQSIHQRFLGSSLNVPFPSTGIFGQMNNHVISSVKPFKAINDLRKMLSFGGSSSSGSVYYRDRYTANLTQVEKLFSQMGSQNTFNQRNTWGANWQNVLGGYDAVLAATTNLNPNQGAGGIKQRSVASQFERRARDVFSSKNPFAQAIQGSGLGGILSSVTGGHGGLQHFPIFDSTVIQSQNLPNTGADAAYQAALTDGPQVTIKVPLQTGITCTVGKGVTVNLIPPNGDYSGPGGVADRNSGNKLVVDLCHTVEMAKEGMQGTTTMRLCSPPA